jgi:alpha-glucosidase
MVDIDRRDLLRLAGLVAAGGLLWRGPPDPPTVQAGDLTVADDATGEQTTELGMFTVHWRERDDGYQVAVERGDTVRWRTWAGENFLEAADARLGVENPLGPHLVTEHLDVVRADQRVSTVTAAEDELRIAGTLSDGGSDPVEYETVVTVSAEGHLRFETTSPAGPDRLGLRYETAPRERYHGFGLQPRHMDLGGKEVRMITEEPGIGRDHVYLEFLVELAQPGASGTTVSTYAPSAYYLSDRGYSFVLENQEYSVFDLRRDRETSVRCYDETLAWRLVGGETPIERIESYTEYCGRMPELPDWIHEGPIVGMQGGNEATRAEGIDSATERVRGVWQELRDRETPLAGFWLQDWVGVRVTGFGQQLWWNWELDEDHYPGWDDFVADLNAAGVEVLGYVNPYLSKVPEDADQNVDRDLYAEATENDYFVTQNNEVFELDATAAFDAAIVDLSDPEAYEWLRDIIAARMADNGFRGWMADFGEGLPFEGSIDGGRADSDSIADYHNEFVVEWARLNREIRDLNEVELGGETIEVDLDDAVFFTRSGFTQTPRHSTLCWTGDQYTSWDDRDGIDTAVRGLLTAGLSGFTMHHFDAGGYTSIRGNLTGLHRRPELLKRWNEVSAFTPVFRTHEGNEPTVNAQIYSSDSLYDHFSRCAKMYASFAPYRKAVCATATERGRPVVRPLFLHYPDDDTTRDIHSQFLLGRDLLVAPILTDEARAREVYVPEDGWTHVWTGDEYDAGRHTVDAPLGDPPVFYRTDADDRALIDESLATLREFGVLER